MDCLEEFEFIQAKFGGTLQQAAYIVSHCTHPIEKWELLKATAEKYREHHPEEQAQYTKKQTLMRLSCEVQKIDELRYQCMTDMEKRIYAEAQAVMDDLYAHAVDEALDMMSAKAYKQDMHSLIRSIPAPAKSRNPLQIKGQLGLYPEGRA